METNNLCLQHGVKVYHKHSPPLRFFSLILVLFLLGLSLAGCVTMTDPEASQDYTSDSIGVLDAETSIGQTFVSRRPDLNGITIWLARVDESTTSPKPDETDLLSVKLFLARSDPAPVYATTLAIPSSGSDLPITISIPDQMNPAGQSYYILLANDDGTIQVDGRNEDAYPHGQAYLSDQPVDADLAFRLTYDYGFSSFLGDVASSLPSIWLIIPLLVILWLPGWLLLEFSGLRSLFDLGEQVALAGGLSLALIPVIMLWTSILKIKWTSQAVDSVTGLLVAVLLVRLVYNAFTLRNRQSPRNTSQSAELSAHSRNKSRSTTFYSLALILIFLAALALRLVMVRDLVTPAWVDSVHHALITRLILDNGAYPSTYQPYFDISPTEYHPGFHSIAAAFTWLSQLDLARSLLILGQVLNAFCIFAVYLFAKTLTRSSLAGLFAAIITGFLTPMPSYYTSWGRYTELAGLLLLPVIIGLIHPWLDGRTGRKTGWMIVLGGLSAGGLFLIHYRVLAFMACLVLSYVAIHLVHKPPYSISKSGHLLLVVISMAVLGIITVVPWFIPTIHSTFLPSVTASPSSSIPFFQGFSWPYLTSALGKQALAIAGLGLLWGLLKSQRFSLILVLWVGLLLLLANLGALNLPGGALISTPSVEIMLFIPVSILGGYFIDQLITLWKAVLPVQLAYPSMGIVLVLAVLVSYLGARQLVNILNPITILSRNADLPAITWVSEHIPPNETLLINPFAWGYGLYAGNDGGYWISPLSRRLTLPPPVLYGLGQDASQTTTLAQQVIATSSDPKAFWEFLRTHHLSYIYIGARGGVIPPEKLASSGLFILIYHQDGVWIFMVNPIDPKPVKPKLSSQNLSSQNLDRWPTRIYNRTLPARTGRCYCEFTSKATPAVGFAS
jgi:hypothetical protein